jgi:dienelactone hydrolase
MTLKTILVAGALACLGAVSAAAAGLVSDPVRLEPPGDPLAGTARLDIAGDIASELVAGVDRFLDRKLLDAAVAREKYWRDASSDGEAWELAVRTNRVRLGEILGVVESRPSSNVFERVATLRQPSLVATSSWVRVEAVRWRAFGHVHGEGLLLEPREGGVVADVVAVPDADVTPEQLAGLEPGVAAESQFARRLAESGCRVVVPYLINRNKGEPKVDWDERRGRNLPNREYLHRAAFEMGRTVAGYEVMKILAAVDACQSDQAVDEEVGVEGRPIGVMGWGEGGRLGLYAAALDTRIGAVAVSGAFGPRGRSWEEPLDRNLFGILEVLGDAELSGLVAPRPLVVEAAVGPSVEQPGDGATPARLTTIPASQVGAEVARAMQVAPRTRAGAPRIRFLESGGGIGAFGSEPVLAALLEALKPGLSPVLRMEGTAWVDLRQESVGGRARADRQRAELDRHTQQLLADSAAVRRTFMKDLDTSSAEVFSAAQARYREHFSDRVIGRFDDPLLPFGARSRRAYEAPAWTGYEVVLDVHPDVMAYGVLLVPKDVKPGERRPVVVCQHGLEGRPQDTLGKAGVEAYAAFAARLAEQGYVTFAPQNLYLFQDRFRVLQRKANPIGRTLFSVIVPQHRQIVNWLKTQPFVDPERIAFYGLSYGGKTAMRVPPLVTDYCLSICSADFNEWVWKNASTRSPYSYVWTGEYEIFEWNLGHTFNYAEMAALIAPRPFMVERGHYDGVAPDETVGYEFAKVRHLYAARLKLPPEACQIEWFVGPHTIHGVGTFEFLKRHLRWNGPAR